MLKKKKSVNTPMIFCKISFCLFIFALLSISASNINAQNKSKDIQSENSRAPFRYVIVSNNVDPKISRSDEDRRFIEVFLDKKSFNKQNLIVLFQLISKRFPKPDLLFVNVYTSLEDIETPEERNQPKFSGNILPNGKQDNEEDSAVFTRGGKKEFFYIYYANGNYEEVRIR